MYILTTDKTFNIHKSSITYFFHCNNLTYHILDDNTIRKRAVPQKTPGSGIFTVRLPRVRLHCLYVDKDTMCGCLGGWGCVQGGGCLGGWGCV